MAQRPPIPPAISFRPVEAADFDFAKTLYLDSTLKLLRALGPVDEARVARRFAKAFHGVPGRIIRRDGQDVGWMQVSESPEGVHLHQLHLVERCRSQGIGSHLIRDLVRRASRQGLPVSLNVIRGNPAIALYERLGFRVVGEDGEKLHMRSDKSAARGRR